MTKSIPEPFKQVQVFSFKHQKNWFPAYVCLMVQKDKLGYYHTFDNIYDKLVPKFQGSEIHIELESETKEALSSVLRNISIKDSNRCKLANTKVKGCMFYYASCILGYIKKHGLISKYWRSAPFKNWVKKIMLLCLLPANYINSTWKKLKSMRFSAFTKVDQLLIEDFKNNVEGESSKMS